MTYDVAGLRWATRFSQVTPASMLRWAVRGWFQATCVARQPVGTAPLNPPGIKSGLDFYKRAMRRFRAAWEMVGSQQLRSSLRDCSLSMGRTPPRRGVLPGAVPRQGLLYPTQV